MINLADDLRVSDGSQVRVLGDGEQDQVETVKRHQDQTPKQNTEHSKKSAARGHGDAAVTVM